MAVPSKVTPQRPADEPCGHLFEQGNSLGGIRTRAKVVPLSALSYRVESTASAELFAKLEHASELVSHAVPSGGLPTLLDRADARASPTHPPAQLYPQGHPTPA